MTNQTEIPKELYEDVATLFGYNQLDHELRPCAVGIGLGCHDLGVAMYTAELFHRGMFPVLIFTGANSRTTVDLFPRGRPSTFANAPWISAFLKRPSSLRPKRRTRGSLAPDSVLVVSRPCQQRRAHATCTLLWPEATVVCASQPLLLPDYIASIGDAKLVIDMIVGDTERVIEYPKRDHAAKQEVPPAVVVRALTRLIDAGYISRRFGGGE